MKIGIFDPYLDTLSGGEKYMLTMAKCLAKTNTVYLFWDKNQEQEIKKTVVSKFGFSLDNISFTENIFSQNVSFLNRLEKSRAFDAIVVLSDGSIPFVACKLFLHFQTPMEWVSKPDMKVKFKLSRVKKIICNSEYTKAYINRKFGIKSIVIYPPITFEEKDYKKENIILNVGRYGIDQAGSSFKKQDFMVEAFKKMIDDGTKNWKFVVIVSTRNKEEREKLNELKKVITSYPVEIIENPENAVLWNYYRKSKIYWHAAGYGEDLHQNPDRAEHFGMSTVEAMGCGAVPVIINAGGQKEIVVDGENGFLWNTQEELIEKTLSLISNKDLLESISRKAQIRAEAFGENRFCEEVNTVIQ